MEITQGNIDLFQTDMLGKIALFPVGKEVSHVFFNMETLQEAHLSIISRQNQNKQSICQDYDRTE